MQRGCARGRDTITITIIGQNDGPAIVGGSYAGAVTQDAAATLASTGAITFSDLDLTDSHTVAVSAARVSLTGNPPAGFAGSNGFGVLTAAVSENTADAGVATASGKLASTDVDHGATAT